MGLFSFAKTIGKKLFGSSDDAAGKIKEHIEEDNPGVEGLEVSYENGQVRLGGNASKEAMEKAILMAGNVEGVEAVETEAVAEAVFVEIKKGDTLWKIAKQHLGDGNRYPEIFEANKEVIKDPDLIYPGQMIRIP